MAFSGGRPSFADYCERRLIWDHLLRDAARMSWNTSSGWETGDAWLDAISIVVAPILLAIKRWRSGLIVRSFLETRYHDGTCFQAGAPDGVLKHKGANGF